MRICAAAVVLVASLSAIPASAQSFTLITTPPSAKIFGLDATGNKIQLGVGTAKIKLEKNATNRYWISADGFATLDTTFVRDIKYEKSVTLALVNRVIKVTALPYDAVIKVNGEARGTGTAEVIVPPGVPVTVEVLKGGFKPSKKTYNNDPGVELPTTERFELVDRMVNVQPTLPRNTQANMAQPTVSVDGVEVGAGNVDVTVPHDKCVTVTVSLPGYKPEPRTLCNKADKQPPAGVLPVALVDRLINVGVTPATADIMVDGKIVGKGTHDLIVRNGSCVTVYAGAPGYNTEMREFCNADNRSLDSESKLNLEVDESYNSSVQSDQANVNFTIEVGPGRTPDQAWQTISQVILGAFDVLEITDKDTGYMRTSWAVTKFSGALIRTRVIVKLGAVSPLKYVVKVASERSERPGASVKDDETFSEWPRLMKSYKDVINELQARLR